MMGFVIAIHVTACALLIIIILIQAGRGGGLVEGFSGVESMFGPKTSTFLTRATSILSTLFFITCISLAFLSVRQSKSLMLNVKPPAASQNPAAEAAPAAAPQDASPAK
jgi:preprotein translocase subunit SecG